MRLIKLIGDIEKVYTQPKGEDWTWRDWYEKGDKYVNGKLQAKIYCKAIIEIMVNGLLCHQEYIVFKSPKGRFYCNVQGKRAYLDEIKERMNDNMEE